MESGRYGLRARRAMMMMMIEKNGKNIAQLVGHKTGKSILCMRGGYAALHKLLGERDTGVIGCTA